MQPSRIRASALAVLLSLGAAMVLFAESSEPAQAGKVNINTASVAELAYLPRLGAKVAARVVEHRKEKPFTRPEELMEVKGIGEKLFVSLKPYIAVSGPTTLNAKVRASSASPRRPAPGPAKEKPANSVPLGKGR
jgi:competence protein ComEA